MSAKQYRVNCPECGEHLSIARGVEMVRCPKRNCLKWLVVVLPLPDGMPVLRLWQRGVDDVWNISRP